MSAAPPTTTPRALDLPGPSRRIVVEPLRTPQPAPRRPDPPPEPAPERGRPEPVRAPEEAPVAA